MQPTEPGAAKSAEQADAGEILLKQEYERLTGATCQAWREAQDAMVRGDYDLLFAVTAKSLAALSMVCGSYNAKDQDGCVLLGLTTQMFNSASAAMTLLMTGYYQQSFTLQRHLVETGNLLDLVRRDSSELCEWVSWKDSLDTPRKFNPSKVIDRLDGKDGFCKSARFERYRRITNLAGHPFAIGLRIVQHQGAWAVGPFFSERAFKSALEELGWCLPYFTLVAMEALPGAEDCLPNEASLTYLKTLAAWQQRCHRTTVRAAGAARLAEYARLLWGVNAASHAPASAESINGAGQEVPD